MLGVEFASGLVAFSPSGCCPLAGAVEGNGDGVCSGLVSAPTLILAQYLICKDRPEIVCLFQANDFFLLDIGVSDLLP